MTARKSKLIEKTSRTFLLTGLILTFLSSTALYFFTKNLLQDQVEESLHSTEARVVNALKIDHNIFSIPPVIEIINVSERKPESLADTIIYDASQDEMEAFRELSKYEDIDGKLYKITVRNLVVESGDILAAIVVAIVSIFLLAFLFLFFFNTKNNIKLWRPFFTNLEEMKKFSITSNEDIQLMDSDITEFSDLRTELLSLTTQVRSDYQNLKQFTEDVSHEMQTPLAIIQAKLDNIINEQNITDKQFEQMSSIQKDVQRLKSLAQRVTLLAKIDNNQFANIENVNISALVRERISSFSEMRIRDINFSGDEDLIVSMDIYLADILINNLLNNAIKHSAESSNINVYTNASSLTVSNPGTAALQHPEKLFLRFYREVDSVQSSGLGLAIVKRICDLYDYNCSYVFKDSSHTFIIDFKNNN